MFSANSAINLGAPSINSVMDYISSQLLPDIRPRNISVRTTSGNWDYLLIPSVSKYLFEDLDIKENLAQKGQNNRPGNVYEKHYICVHDTGDGNLDAKDWSEIVKNGKHGSSDYNISYQYVVGNDGYYHMIPDNEIAYHAGDGHTEESIFGVIPSGVFIYELKNEKPKIEVNEEGYYLIDGKKSEIKAPTKYEYYLGRTWYCEKYGYISNYGGNLNSIGIETSVKNGTDVYYSYQKVAKLVANLMVNNNLTIDRVVQHHYFSGKDCPETMRHAGLWDYYKTLILAEYQMLLYKNMGFKFEFISQSEYINNKGRIIKPVEKETIITYNIKVTDAQGNALGQKFTSYLYPD